MINTLAFIVAYIELQSVPLSVYECSTIEHPNYICAEFDDGSGYAMEYGNGWVAGENITISFEQ